MANVPSLSFLDEDEQALHWEFLIHGVIEGAWYSAIPKWKFDNIQFPEALYWATAYFIPERTDRHY